mgnify:FL=1
MAPVEFIAVALHQQPCWGGSREEVELEAHVDTHVLARAEPTKMEALCEPLKWVLSHEKTLHKQIINFTYQLKLSRKSYILLVL